MVLPFRNNPIRFIVPQRGKLSFITSEKISLHSLSSTRKNPIKADFRSYGDSRAARIFVGLSIKGRQTYSLAYLVSLVREFLRKRKFPEDSSFLSQRGVYTHQDSHKTIEEDSAQVVIINMGSPESKFKKTIVSLGEHICKIMRQDSVIVDYQKNGISEHIWEVVS
jgi:hypothetical protein